MFRLNGQDGGGTVILSYTSQDTWNGQSLASLGRRPVAQRRHSESGPLAGGLEPYSEMNGSPGTVDESGSRQDCVLKLKQCVIDELGSQGHVSHREEPDRSDVLIDYGYLDLLLRVAASGVRVGLEARYAKAHQRVLTRQNDLGSSRPTVQAFSSSGTVSSRGRLFSSPNHAAGQLGHGW